MKVSIIGSGAQGYGTAEVLLEDPIVTEIRLSDINLETAKHVASELKNDKVSVHLVDASKVEDIMTVSKGVDLVVNAVIPRFNLNVMEAAFKVGANYIDMAFAPPYDLEHIESIFGQTKKWKKAGLTALTSTGGSPGVTNCLVARAAEQLDRVDEVHIKSGGRIKPGTKFLEGKQILSAGWSPETAWEDVAANPTIYEDGKWKEVPHWYGEEILDGIANTTCHAHEEVMTIPRFIKGINKMTFKMAGATVLVSKAILDLGLLSTEPVDIKGTKVVPRDLFYKIMPRIPTPEERAKMRETGAYLETERASVIEVIGEKDGIRTTISYRSLPRPSESQVERRGGGAGTFCGYFALMLLNGEIKTKGVIAPECLTKQERENYLDKLKEQGLLRRLELVERELK